MKIESNGHYMIAYIGKEIYSVDTVFYESKSMVLKNTNNEVLTVSFDEIDILNLETFEVPKKPEFELKYLKDGLKLSYTFFAETADERDDKIREFGWSNGLTDKDLITCKLLE